MLNNALYDDPSIPKFYAVNLRNVPPCAPEELNMFSMATRLAALEKQMAEVKEAHRKPEAGLGTAAEGNRNDPSTLPKWPDPKFYKADTIPKVVTSSEPPYGPRTPQPPLSQQKRKNQEFRKKVKSVAKEMPKVIGTAPASETLRRSQPVKYLFVNRVAHDISSDMMKDHLTSKGVKVVSVHATSKPDWSSASFKIAIAGKDMERAMQPDFWPAPIACREWVPHWRKNLEPPRDDDQEPLAAPAAPNGTTDDVVEDPFA